MGAQLFDHYSLLHFATGIIAYFWGVRLNTWLIIHILFEIIENTNCGMQFINTELPFWPGGKPFADTITNSIGDTIAGVFGWYVAYKCAASS